MWQAARSCEQFQVEMTVGGVGRQGDQAAAMQEVAEAFVGVLVALCGIAR